MRMRTYNFGDFGGDDMTFLLFNVGMRYEDDFRS